MSDGLKLLGAIIDTGSVHILRDLDRGIFIDEEIALYDMMRLHYRRYGQVPTIATVEDEVGVEIPSAEESIDYYIKRVHDRRLYSVIRDKFNELKDKLRDFNMDEARETIDEMRAATRIIHTESDIRNLSEAAEGAMREYEYAHENPGVSGVPTGKARFDAATGGYQPGDLVTYVARMGMGKTYFLLDDARAAWHFGYSVLVVTMEMTIEQITRRLLAMESGLDPDCLRKGMLSVYARRRLQAVVDNLAGTERFRLFSGGMRKKVSDVDILIQEYRPDIVFIDGVYLMHPESKRGMQKNEKVSEVFDELKAMTLAHNIPVVVTTQFNRTAGKKGKDGSLESIAYSDAISTHSSLVIAINEGEAPNQAKQRVRQFLKGREGEAGKFPQHFVFTPINFTEIVKPEHEEDENGNVPTVATQSGGGAGVDWMG